MAYRRSYSSGRRSPARRSTSYRRAPARRTYGRARRSAAGRGGGRGQTIRLVIEAAPASGVSRNAINPVPGVPLTGPKKAKM